MNEIQLTVWLRVKYKQRFRQNLAKIIFKSGKNFLKWQKLVKSEKK